MLDKLGQNLDEARAKIDRARAALLAIPYAQERPEGRKAVERLERLAEELERVEEAVAGEAVPGLSLLPKHFDRSRPLQSPGRPSTPRRLPGQRDALKPGLL